MLAKNLCCLTSFCDVGPLSASGEGFCCCPEKNFVFVGEICNLNGTYDVGLKLSTFTYKNLCFLFC